MQNITTKQDGNKLIITIDLSAPGQISATGKSTVIASTHGNQAVCMTSTGQPVILGLNCYIKR